MTTPRPSGTRRPEHSLALPVWGTLLVGSILFAIATAGIGVFAVGIVLAAGVVMLLLRHGAQS